MADNLPGRRIDRDALERILQRAAELQAGEVDTGEAMTEQELLKLGAEVGIDGRHLRQALYEEGAGPIASERGFVARWIGPSMVRASRVVRGERAAIEEALDHWMTGTELLAVKRRMPDRYVYERQKGFFAEMKRGFGVGGRSYQLSKAREVTFAVTALETGYAHVEMTADIKPSQQGFLGGSVAIGATGATGAVIAGTLGAPVVVPVLALVVFGTGAWGTSRGHRVVAEKTQVALEQVLDRLEHGEILPRHQIQPASPITKIADEIRRAIGEGIEQSRQSRQSRQQKKIGP